MLKTATSDVASSLSSVKVSIVKSFIWWGIIAGTKEIFEEQLANDTDSNVVINLNNKLCNYLRKPPYR